MKLCYSCNYDGNKCNKAFVSVSRGELLAPTNDLIKKRYQGKLNDDLLDWGWDICCRCERNNTITGICSGHLAVDYDDHIRRI